MKRIVLLAFFVFISNFLFSQNNSSGIISLSEDDMHVAENWSMVTNAGYGYNLIFNNENKTFKLKSIGECSFPIRQVINGKFRISEEGNKEIISLIFNDFTIDYYFKYPQNSSCASDDDIITEKEKETAFSIELDDKGYSTNYVMLIKEVKVKNKKDKTSQYYDDLINPCFEYSAK